MKKWKHVSVATILGAFVFSFLTILPHLQQRLDTRYPFQGIEIMAHDAEIHYSARVQEIVDGFWTGNTFYSEPKDQPFLQPPLPEAVPAFLARSLNIEPVIAFTFFSALCAFGLFLTMTGSVSSLTGWRWKSLLSVSALLFVGALLGAPWDLSRYVFGSGAVDLLRFTRPINPLWTAPWFFGAIWLTALWVESRQRRFMLFAAPVLAVLVYSYVYAWSYLAVSLGLLTLWFTVKKDWKRVFDLCFCGLLVAVLSAPYILSLLSALAHPLYEESAVRVGVIASHEPAVGIWSGIALILLALSHRCWGLRSPCIISLLLGGLIAMNQQVITGSSIVAHHYHWYFFHPIVSMLTMALLLRAAEQSIASARVRSALTAVLLLGAIAFGIRHQTLAYETASAYWGQKQPMAPALRYIDKHLIAGQVVYATDNVFNDLVPVYSSADVYTATNANNYLVSLERARDVFFFDLWMQGYTARDVETEFPTTLRSKIGTSLYGIHFREQYGSYDAVTDAIVSENIESFKKFLLLSFDQKLALYPIDIVVFTPESPDTTALREIRLRSREVFAEQGYSIRILNTSTVQL
jgi:hypothetical protein